MMLPYRTDRRQRYPFQKAQKDLRRLRHLLSSF